MKFNINFQATGTTWQIDYVLEASEEKFDDSFTQSLELSIKQRLDEYENTYSRFRPDSLASRIAKATVSKYIFPEDAEGLFALYRNMYDATGGLVTPLIGQVISDAGYDAVYSLKPKPNILSAKNGMMLCLMNIQHLQ